MVQQSHMHMVRDDLQVHTGYTYVHTGRYQLLAVMYSLYTHMQIIVCIPQVYTQAAQHNPTKHINSSMIDKLVKM